MPHGRPRAALVTALLAALVFLVALNLRPTLTSVGPLLEQIGDEEGLSEGQLGLLGALPLLAFAIGSPLVHRMSRRFGAERTVFVALLVLAGGALLRSYGGAAGLWTGTLVVGLAIAVGNVLVPAFVKRDYSQRIALATGAYTAVLTLAAATASAVAVPLAAATDWRYALAIWAVPALVAAVLWIPRMRARTPVVAAASPAAPLASVWRQRTAWLVTAFMGVQSTTFYVMITWFPTIETSQGFTAAEAGVHLFVYILVGIPGGLLVPLLMRRTTTLVRSGLAASVPVLVGTVGLLLTPSYGVLWAVVIGMGSGASLVVALSLISIRGRTHHETTQLSGMAQSLGYLFAALGPVVAGYLTELTGSWSAALVLVVCLAALQIAVATQAGKDRRARLA